jgi:putative DNA methylase
VDHPQAKELFDRYTLPAFYDPFAGGGTLPLEAQRLGLKSYASDLNPVAVLITKSLIEIPQRFAGIAPVNSDARSKRDLIDREWFGVEGLAEDIRHFGKWMWDQADKKIGHLYPKVQVTAEIAEGRPDLKPLIGQSLTVIAWLWARTVKSPNPAFAETYVPLATTFILSSKVGRESYVEPIVEGDHYRFAVKIGRPKDVQTTRGTKSGGSGSSFLCLMSGTPMPFDYIRAEAKAGRMAARLMAIVVESEQGRMYLPPTDEVESLALSAQPIDVPETELPAKALGFRVQEYGMTKWRDLFTGRQLMALTTFSDLVDEVRHRVKHAALDAGLADGEIGFDQGGSGAQAYADAIGTYLAFSVDKAAEYGCTIVPWYSKEDRPKGLFARQAIPMVWDYAEVNPFADLGGSFDASCRIVAGALGGCYPDGATPVVSQANAMLSRVSVPKVVSTDPPYYDNIGYADLSDFFYVWLRRSLKPVFPDLFKTVAVPKAEELVAAPHRQGSKEEAEVFFLTGMTEALHQLAEESHPAFPVTIYYAYKQSETEGDSGRSSTGWETFVGAVIKSGLNISGTWPLRTERGARSISKGANALASSIVLVCHPRSPTAPTATRRDFLAALKEELPGALGLLQRGNIAPVDLAQAAIGPGMRVYTRYSKIIEADGTQLSVRDALALINS